MDSTGQQKTRFPFVEAGFWTYMDFIMAEREGFEPSVESYPHTRLAGEHHRPLGHLSTQ